jgi:hypothetical protein
LYISLPPGKEAWRPALLTSHGRRRVVTLMTVSSWPLLNWPSQHGKASIEA